MEWAWHSVRNELAREKGQEIRHLLFLWSPWPWPWFDSWRCRMPFAQNQEQTLCIDRPSDSPNMSPRKGGLKCVCHAWTYFLPLYSRLTLFSISTLICHGLSFIWQEIKCDVIFFLFSYASSQFIKSSLWNSFPLMHSVVWLDQMLLSFHYRCVPCFQYI